MPRGKRFILPGQTYHVTHRCHQREFLLKFKQDRTVYREMMRERLATYRIALFNYTAISNHVHLLLRPNPETLGQSPSKMQVGIRRAIGMGLLVLSTFSAPAAAEEGTRVALVTTCARLSVQSALALAEVELSSGEGLVLVEREEIDRVLGEQQTCELFSASRAVELGHLLDAEVFAVVENYAKDHKAVALVVFDALRGIRLWDTRLPEGTPEEIRDAVVDGVRNATQKYWIAEGLTTVCLLSVRNVDLPIEQNSACTSVGTLVERQLVGSDLIAVMERKRLEHINRERRLPLSAPAGDLFPTLVTLDLEIARLNADGGLKGTLSFTGSQGERIGRVEETAAMDDWAGLAEALVAKVAAFLQVSPAPQPGNRLQEAQRFSQESEYRGEHDDPLGALYAIESAHALDPANTSYQNKLVLRLEEVARALARDALGSVKQSEEEAEDPKSMAHRSLRMAARALDIATEMRVRRLANPRLGDTPEEHRDYHYIRGREHSLVSFVVNTAEKLEDRFGREEQRIVEKLKADLRHLLVELVAMKVRTSADHYKFATMICNLQQHHEELCPNPVAWTDDMLKVFNIYADYENRLAAMKEWKLDGTRILVQLICQTGNKPKSEQQRMLPFIKRMEEHPFPIFNMYGSIGRLHLERNLNGYSQHEVATRYESVRDFIRSMIERTWTDKKFQRERFLSYQAAADAIDLFIEPDKRQEAYQELFEYMLARRDFEMVTIQKVVHTRNQTFQVYKDYCGGMKGRRIEKYSAPKSSYPRLLENCNRALALVRSKDFGNVSTAFYVSMRRSPEELMLKEQRKLLKLMPELAPEPELPWTEARRIFSLPSRKNGTSIVRSLMTDREAYLLCEGGTGRRMTLVRLPFDGGGAVTLGVSPPYKLAGEMSLSGDTVYVGTRDRGVLAFSSDGSLAIRIDASSGFIDGPIESTACVGGKLYAGVRGRSLITSYDLQTLESKIVVSGNRKGTSTPLDNQIELYDIPFMMGDPDRNRVLFTTSLRSVEKGGIWQIDLATDEVTRLVPMACRLESFSLHRRDRLLFHAMCIFGGMNDGFWSTGVIDLDLATDRSFAVATWDEARSTGGPTVEYAKILLGLEYSEQRPMMMLNSELWLRLQRDELGILSQGSRVPEPIPAKSAYSGKCGIWDKTRLLPDGRVAALNSCGVWLLEMPDGETTHPDELFPPAPRTIEVNGETTVEVESFSLSHARVEPMKEASGGKVVRFTGSGRAVQPLTLPAGRYEFILYAKGIGRKGGLHMLVGEHHTSNQRGKTAMVAEKADEIVPWRRSHDGGVVEMKSAGDLRVILRGPNKHYELDRLVVRPLGDADRVDGDKRHTGSRAKPEPSPEKLEMFRRMDGNADGKVTRDEYLGLFLANFPNQDKDGNGMLSEAEFNHPAFSYMDTDGDGQATLTEFKELRHTHFDQLDKDRNGLLTTSEL